MPTHPPDPRFPHAARGPCHGPPAAKNSALLVTLLLALLVKSLAGRPVAAAGTGEGSGSLDADAEELKNLSIEELMDLEVTIATRSAEQLSNLPAAVYVLTGDEIRRAGHTSIQEALRMVPGFYVSHWTTAAWDVTARGFSPGLSLTSSAFLNQLLVMVDGVVMYSPLFAGVWWHLLDIDMNSIDRIEIMRGPGGSLWGTNATHGVVHVITKDSASTQGARLSGSTGNDDHHAGGRWGGKLGDNGTYRVWGKAAWYETMHASPLDFDNSWESQSAGFRADWKLGGQDVTVWSRFYDFSNHAFGFDPVDGTIPVIDKKKGYQLYAGLSDPEAGSRLQAWFTTDQQAQPTFLDYTIDSFDLDYQREFALSASNRLTAGLGYRHIQSDIVGDDPFFEDFDPHVQRQDIFRGFLIDRVALASLDSELTLGLTLEHNDFTQFEFQPTARWLWNATEELVAWAAVSRAVRTPSLEENSLSADSFFVGDDAFEAEVLIAYESGVRTLLSDNASIDIALYYNDYDDLHYEEFVPSTSQYLLTNEAEGHSYGAELAFDYKPSERWTTRSAYSFGKGHYESKTDGSSLGNEEYYPEHLFNLRSYYDLGSNWELDGAVYLVEKMGPAFDIAEYWRVDLRLGWRPSAELELYVGVQSLNDPLHSEFSDTDFVRRSAYFGLNWNPGATAE
jgi:iron complex outermembrane receptor protein